MRRTIPALCLATLVWAALSGSAALGAAPVEYQDLIAGYRDRDGSVVHKVAALSADDLKTLPHQFTLIEWQAGDVLAAAMMHLDACVELLQTRRAGEAFLQLNAAGRFLDAATRRWPEADGFARRWYAAVVTIVDAAAPNAWSDEIRQRAAARFAPTPARAAFADGLDLELHGVVEGPISRSDPRWRERRDPVAVRWFRLAAARFATAESLDPDLLEAALHQGRAWMLAGEPARVAAPLERAARSTDPPVRYLAGMLLGALDEEAGRLESAESRYRAAASIAPFAQSAPLALAHLLTRLGRTADARTVLTDHFARTTGHVAEPLWTYLAAPSGHLAETLQNLRAEVWR